ncbi:hypothetical protein Tco_0427262, partial [Tanacetum coccineum]
KAYEERIKGAEKMEDTQGGLLLVSEGKSHGCNHCGNGGSNQLYVGVHVCMVHG